ncbi:hypothetical protein BCR44DRAFT_1430896 [Catenaria anguillulae PL171]|uniref:DUF7918 domain-containing protein n=1 Tax=Catenaria anguillulae PL171 TaxID=765915 RepID=A0A1Y2HRU0_9FUNG|nr:hypothetical protein BCR44DRAFT_1430896 [Catenaria anguillulae PL171]
MPSDGDFEVKVEINGVPAEEYNVTTVTTDDEIRQTRCNIASIAGARFITKSRYIHGGIDFTTNFVPLLKVDGTSIIQGGGRLTDRDYLLDYAIDGNQRRPLEFAPMKAIADPSELRGLEEEKAMVDNQQAGQVGSITVEIWTASFTQRAQPYVPHRADYLKQKVLGEGQKKAVFVTHSTGFGQSIGQYNPPATITHRHQKVAEFIFYYASRESLEMAGKIPKSLTSTKKRHAESDDDDDHEPVKKESDVKLAKVKAEKRRRLAESNAAASSASGPKKVVSLDDSDDERPRPARPASTQPQEKIVISLLDSDED